MGIDIKRIVRQEAYLQFEFYRIINNYIEKLQRGILSRDILDLLDRKLERSFNIYPEVPATKYNCTNGSYIILQSV